MRLINCKPQTINNDFGMRREKHIELAAAACIGGTSRATHQGKLNEGGRTDAATVSVMNQLKKVVTFRFSKEDGAYRRTNLCRQNHFGRPRSS